MLTVKINDADPDFKEDLGVAALCESFGVALYADGYGDQGSAPGHGSPVYLELHQGVLRVLVWADINAEEPTHIIDLKDARESNRLPTPTESIDGGNEND